MSLRRRDWVNEEGATVTQRYFIDDDFYRESHGPANHPYPDHCNTSGMGVDGEILSLGAHDIRIEVILNGNHAESDVENNSSSRVVVVVE